MPFKYIDVPAEVFLEYNGVRILCTYENGDYSNEPFEYHFQLDGWEDDESFDVRDLKTWDGDRNRSLKKAIDSGEITNEMKYTEGIL